MNNPLHAQSASNSIQSLVYELARDTKNAGPALLRAEEDTLNKVLNDLADLLDQDSEAILAANKKDLDAAEAKGLEPSKIDRLTLNKERILAIADSIQIVRDLASPVGNTLWSADRPNGLKIERVSVPFGTLGMIYEARPNVTVDAAILALKSRNTILLRGGSESLKSCMALHALIQKALEQNDLPAACVSLIPTPDREAVGVMLSAADYIDVMIPRGSASLTSRVMEEARMPVFGHLDGLCHTYVDKSAKPEIARDVPLNAKMRRTGICGSMETLLLDKDLDQALAKEIISNLLDAGCEIVGDKMAQKLDSRIGEASANDWGTEYLAAKLSCAVVSGVDEAINHINAYGSHHTESILAEDEAVVQKFLQSVDSGIVMHNTSTQFADGGEFGMGAEIGIATGKLHARGPVGVEQLTTYKYIVRGNGQVRS